jgi:hypothetical protein
MQIVEPDPASIWQFSGIFPVPKNIRNGDLESEVALKISGRELTVSVLSRHTGAYGECLFRVDSRRLAESYIRISCTSEFGATTDIRQTPGMDM